MVPKTGWFVKFGEGHWHLNGCRLVLRGNAASDRSYWQTTGQNTSLRITTVGKWCEGQAAGLHAGWRTCWLRRTSAAWKPKRPIMCDVSLQQGPKTGQDSLKVQYIEMLYFDFKPFERAHSRSPSVHHWPAVWRQFRCFCNVLKDLIHAPICPMCIGKAENCRGKGLNGWHQQRQTPSPAPWWAVKE